MGEEKNNVLFESYARISARCSTFLEYRTMLIIIKIERGYPFENQIGYKQATL